MRASIKKGFGFGITSGVITTLGLIIGLNSSTHSFKIIIGGIFIIGIADALSDALGIHVSEESERKNSAKKIWESTFATFFAKFIIAITFIVPILLFDLNFAILISIAWGLFLISLFSFYIAKHQNLKAYKTILEHLTLAILVIFITHLVGSLIEKI
ncbi:MAG: hypothetical protein WC548_00140 [Candidatus Pacearchaeota archaeon]